MKGMNATTGKPLDGIAHLRQSIIDILTTPIGSRIMRRDYGSRLFELIDAPVNRETLQDIYDATAEALITWEPRFQLMNVQVTQATLGKIELSLKGIYLPDGKAITFDGIQVT